MRPDAHRDLKQFGGIRLRSVTLRGAEQDRLLARLRLERALDPVDWTPRGLPTGALLLVRRLVAMRGARATLAQTVTHALHEHSRTARRPWLDEHAAQADAVWFDRGELAACLARDALRGRVSQRWWWPGVLDGRDPDQWLREQVLDHGERVVSLLAMLSGRGDAVAWLRRLADPDAARGLEAVIRDYALPSVAQQAWQVLSSDVGDRVSNVAPGMHDVAAATAATAKASANAAAHCAKSSGSTATSPRAVARLLAAAPELPTAPLRSTAQRLLGHARVAMHDPNWLRSREFVAALNDWIDSRAAVEIDPAEPERPAPTTGAARGAASSAATTIRSIDASKTPISERSHPHQAAAQDRTARSSSRDTSDPARITAAEQNPPERYASAVASPCANDPIAQADIESNADAYTANMDDAETGTVPSPTIDRIPDLDGSQTQLSPDAIGSEHTAHRIDTDFGGLFYLLNVALALDLYGDFTSPRTPGIALSPWDWLAMIGRTWFGASFRNDPLDVLLAQLAGRVANQAPGADFAPARDWSTPDAWLRPWGQIDRLDYQAGAGRLRLWHPQGFVVFDQPRDRDHTPAAQTAALCATREPLRGAALQRVARLPSRTRSRQSAQRWLDRLLPYLHARIAVALGLDPQAADVPAQVCRHVAHVRCDLTHVDVHLSLATLPLSLRIAGLDRDPGWIPAAGRSIRFHFDAAGFDTIRPDRAGDRA